MKCVGCINGCGFVKGVIGLSLIALGAWFEMSDHEIVNCSSLQLTCPTAFGQLALAVANMSTTAPVPTSIEAEVAAYCTCLQSCVNYAFVYDDHTGPSDPATTNCYRLSAVVIPSASASIPPAAMVTIPPTVAPAPLRRLLSSAHRRLAQSVGPLGGSTCVTCSDIQEQENLLFRGLAGLACVCGMALLFTAFCEHVGMKMHSTCFSLLVLFTDCAVSATLVTGSIVAVVGSIAAAMGCDPESVRTSIANASAESTDGNTNNAALFANFLLTIFLPMAEAICATGPKFSTFATLTSLGCTVSTLSCLATFCVCLGCSDDHEDENDPNAEQARQIQGLMNQDQQGGFE